MELLLKVYDADKSGYLDKNELYNLLVSKFPRITPSDSEHIFNLMDYDRNKQVNAAEFQACFCEWNYIEVNDVGERLLRDFREIIKNNNYDIKNLFYTYEKDHN